jgi:ABC-type multidrug transport system fused ATPase/permease subunit
VLGFPESGKTTFINTILGNVNILKGSIKYRGKIGYVSQKTWYKNQTIRANVLMGRRENPELLNKVYHMAELDMELNFLSRKDRTRMTDSNSFSEGQKKRISIARALYGEPDILIMDDPFINLDNETSKIIYDRISDGLPNTLMITATHSASIIRPTDRVIIFEGGHVGEYDTYARLVKSSSLLHKLIEITP